MSNFYNPQRARNLFDPKSRLPYKLSRSQLELFIECPRCFYLDRRLGTGRPRGPAFSLNIAVDKLLKKEFDIHRAASTAHPFMKTYAIDAVPFQHEKLDIWRDALGGGVQFLHEPLNLLISGGVDDVWVNSSGELHVVDYKATSKDEEVTLDAEWQNSYKRQAEIYQWLFRKNNFRVNDIAYFVYCNGDTDKDAFDGKLEFSVKIIPYQGKDDWVEGAILKVYKCLISEEIPPVSATCDFCRYKKALDDHEKRFAQQRIFS